MFLLFLLLFIQRLYHFICNAAAGITIPIYQYSFYIKFFEDGREAFGKAFSLGYLDIYAAGYATPIVNINIDFKKTVKYGDSIIIETTFINSQAAKLIFHYRIFRASDNELVATGESTQVFVTLDYQLYITVPDFLNKWKNLHLTQH